MKSSAAIPFETVREPLDEKRVLGRSLALALLIEAVIVTAVGIHEHWLAHPIHSEIEPSHFIEAQMMTLPPEKHLVEAKPIKVPAPHEAVLSKVPNQGRKAKPEDQHLARENVTHSSSEGEGDIGPTHGPVAMYNPAPVIPPYLRSTDLSRTVVIEFLISALGTVTPRLVASSGSEELDAIAIDTVKKWQFRPAEQGHKAVESKVKLRIVFDVH